MEGREHSLARPRSSRNPNLVLWRKFRSLSTLDLNPYHGQHYAVRYFKPTYLSPSTELTRQERFLRILPIHLTPICLSTTPTPAPTSSGCVRLRFHACIFISRGRRRLTFIFSRERWGCVQVDRLEMRVVLLMLNVIVRIVVLVLVLLVRGGVVVCWCWRGGGGEGGSG